MFPRGLPRLFVDRYPFDWLLAERQPMTGLLDRKDVPSHLFTVPELDFSNDLFADRVSGPWFRLGARTLKPSRDARGVEDVVSRQSLLIEPGAFSAVFDKLESIGNVLHSLGEPGGSVQNAAGEKKYHYAPFHHFAVPFTSIVGEPLVFVHSDTSGVGLFINPDLSMYFGLEEKSPGRGIWWDPKRGAEVLIRRTLEDSSLALVDIRTDYLLKYLQVRQQALVMGHYRHLHLYNPAPGAVAAFVRTDDLVLGAPALGTKALLHNWGQRQDLGGTEPFLQRRLHLWFSIEPLGIDVDDPWSDTPPSTRMPSRCPPMPGLWPRHAGGDCERRAGRAFPARPATS